MNPRLTCLDRAESLLKKRHLAAARSLFWRAEVRGHDADRCAGGRWMAAMLSGDFQAAWRESDAIRLRDRPDPNRLWKGESLSGKDVIVRCLHGYGDAIQLLRYAPLIKARAARVIVECAPRAAPILCFLPGIDQVIPWGADAPAAPPAWEVQMEVMEAPYVFRSTVADLPIATNYLHLPGAELDRAARILTPDEGAVRIGVAWSAGEWNPSRSIPLRALMPILNRREFEFWNLQGGAVRNEWRTLGSSPHLRDASLLADSGLASLAAVIAHLDLVISVDTLAAHLAGALGAPCFLVLQHAADWRWMTGRDDSPWYPSLRLFRQPAPGDWAAVVSNLDRALTASLAEQRKLEAAA